MNRMPIQKYQPYPKVDLPDRQWPTQTISTAPIWCSVDLRDGNQALINPMTLTQKLEMFQLLVNMGFKEIEVGFPSAAQVEWDFLRKLIDDNLIPEDVTVQVLVQCREHLIRKTFEALRGTHRAIVHIYNSTSELQRRVVFRKDKSEIIEIAANGAKLVKSLAEAIEGTEIVFQYSPESFTGTELDFSLEICEAVLDVWQPTPEKRAIINLPATVEMSTPNIFADRIEWFSKNVKNRESIILSVHPHNDRGTAIAAAELALMAGADRVEGTLFGNGERTGNLDILTLALNLFSQGVDPHLDVHNIQKLIDVYQRCTQLPVHDRHPYAGQLVYTAFSGSHQDAINKGMQSYNLKASESPDSELWEVPYLPIDPRDVGRTYEAIIRINSQSGKGGVAYIMEQELGYKLPKSMHPEFGKVVQAYSDKVEREVLPHEIFQCFKQEYLDATSPIFLKRCQLHTIPSNQAETQVQVQVQAWVTVDNQGHKIVGTGNGPIDAFSHGIKEAGLAHYKLLSYDEHALSTGSNSQAVAYIQIEAENGNEYFGVGEDSDITIASIKAILSALNRVHAEQTFRAVPLETTESISGDKRLSQMIV